MANNEIIDYDDYVVPEEEVKKEQAGNAGSAGYGIYLIYSNIGGGSIHTASF